MYLLSSIQLLHVAQAVELRGPPALGRETRRLFEAYRAQVPYVTEDRAYTADFAAGAEVLRAFAPQR
ncbi:Histidine ammonia-lyase [compost metagenome]